MNRKQSVVDSKKKKDAAMTKDQKSSIHSMLGTIALQIQDDQLQSAEENLKAVTQEVKNVRVQRIGLETDNDVTKFNDPD